MDIKNLNLGHRILLAAVVPLTVVFSYRYVTMEMDRRALERTLTEIRETLQKTEREKGIIQGELDEEIAVSRIKGEQLEQLLKEKETLEKTLNKIEADLVNTQTALGIAKEKAVELEGNLAVVNREKGELAQEVTSLHEAKESLEGRISVLTEEKTALEAKLRSIKELKIAFKAAKQEALERRIKSLEEKDAEELAEGNKGCIIKNGQSTLGTKVKIRVLPADL